MAGSILHIVDDEGRFYGTEMLDHLGDAYEALEECFFLIYYLSDGGKASKINAAARKASKDGFHVMEVNGDLSLEEHEDDEGEG